MTMIVFFTNTGFKTFKHSFIAEGTPVIITATFTETETLTWTGTFITSGALNISGDAIMEIGPNTTGEIAHCTITLIRPNGIITIHEECQFATSPYKGRWEIVSGTGAYVNLRGNGSLLMPENEDVLT